MASYPTTCNWLVVVASGHPEPDSYADTVMEVECPGTPVGPHPDYPDAQPGDALLCESGHRRLTCELEFAPYGPSWAEEEAERRGAGRGRF